MHSIMLAMGSTGQGKFACTIWVWLKQLGESYLALENPRLAKTETKNPRLKQSETNYELGDTRTDNRPVSKIPNH